MRIILGVDPGTQLLGYGVIALEKKEAKVLAFGVLKLAKYKDAYKRLQYIYQRLMQVIEEYKPTDFAIEAPFYGKNVQSMLKLGRAQGVAMAAALAHDLTIAEYAPRKVKMAITGNGNASKEQVSALVRNILKIKEVPEYFDSTDALAIAMCHFYGLNSPISKAGYTSWKDFIHKNPGQKK